MSCWRIFWGNPDGEPDNRVGALIELCVSAVDFDRNGHALQPICAPRQRFLHDETKHLLAALARLENGTKENAIEVGANSVLGKGPTIKVVIGLFGPLHARATPLLDRFVILHGRPRKQDAKASHAGCRRRLRRDGSCPGFQPRS